MIHAIPVQVTERNIPLLTRYFGIGIGFLRSLTTIKMDIK